MEHPIDFVVTWLDSTDPKWQDEFNKYRGSQNDGDTSSARYRDWDLFKYWFRAVEEYAPWVNRVFLVTNGSFPKWINPNHPKLVLVKHSDYIPEEFLPTFNSCTIELHMNKIPGLSEHFVYFNDDCYINAPISPEYYFRDGLPCDCNKETFFNVPKYNPTDKFLIYISMLVDIGILNAHYDRSKVWRQSPKRWFGPHLGISGLLLSFIIMLSRKKKFVGFSWKHIELPFLKSVLNEVWDCESKMLEASCTRFREDVILNPYIFRYWQFASNRFYPVSRKDAEKYRTVKDQMPIILDRITNSRIKSLCINDTPFCSDAEFFEYKKSLHDAFNKKLQKKSNFEL